MKHKEQVKEQIEGMVALHNERGLYRAPLVGFSSPQDPLYRQIKESLGPEHLYPEEVLPDAETVISFFIPFSKSLVESNQQQWAVSREWVESYDACSRLIDRVAQMVCESFTLQGFSAVPAPKSQGVDPMRFESGWSHPYAAYVAGLGTFGIHQLLITKKGCAGCFGTVFTAARLEADLRADRELCIRMRKGYCRSCVNRCPAGALTLSGFNKNRCKAQFMRNAALHPDIPHGNVCGKCAVGRCAIME